MNAGVLPDGRIFVLSNPSTRQTLVISLSSDGYNFSTAYDVASCSRAPFSDPRPPTSQPDGCKRRNTNPGVGFGVCYPQGVVVEELASLFVIVSNNPEDIWVLKIPLASLSAAEAAAGSSAEAAVLVETATRGTAAATKTLKTDEEDAAVAPAANLKPHGFHPGLRIKHCFLGGGCRVVFRPQ